MYRDPQVADGEVEYRDISIEGPNGIIRTSPPDNVVVDPPVCSNVRFFRAGVDG